MSTPLKIVMLSSECVPYAKTGGLADVVGAVPQALRQLGHEVIVIMPRYGSIDGKRHGLKRQFQTMGVWMGDCQEWCAVDVANNRGVPTYFIECNKYFDRHGLYHDAFYNDHGDNPYRFSFLTRAGLQLCKDLGFKPDIVHAHDWQTALASAYLKIWHWDDPDLGKAASVLSIHNLAYQGKYSQSCYEYLGLQWGNFTADKFEDHGSVNFLKGGLRYADMIHTVSPTYAAETRSPEEGYGLAPLLNERAAVYRGILNGVDTHEWSPEQDPLIAAKYSVDDMAGKAACKSDLQRRFGLQQDPQVPLIGVVSRLASQKGLDLLAGCIERVMDSMNAQFVILGTGDKSLEHFYGELPSRYPGRVGSHIGYSNELAHVIEAGCDFFAMPSRYEPCGLNQLYSLRYGTLPIVRATGGLNDTVEQYDEESGAGTGFKFWEASENALYYTIGWAVSTWYDRPEHIAALRRRGMTRDFSWTQSASQYVEMYREALANKG